MSPSLPAESGAPQPLIGIGPVRHTRLRPVRHAFAYRSYFLLLPMRRLAAAPVPALRRNRFGAIAFHDRDHGDGRADALAWFDELLASEGLRADGEVWLHCLPRVLGYAFKPVSFWYGHRADGSLAAIVAEVNNTFGERHCYLLAPPPGGRLAFGQTLQATKVFHVSPFCAVGGDYRFRFLRTDLGAPGAPGGRTVVRVDHHDADGALLQTSAAGELAPLTPARIRQAFFGVPLMTLGVVLRIHWQALQLWLKRLPLFRKPEPPRRFVTR
ncbi:DUF1365 domain-containing protein [Piscinibacter sakaiensis]|uniref:DUF1365 domain-containing protein n=1 Tax=Piscinibacter sakaiensis TaxID=1547922 RepID=UPI0006B51B8B|nr:DUF1365 domain-containing protein [Piscinibacter sakaiensis]